MSESRIAKIQLDHEQMTETLNNIWSSGDLKVVIADMVGYLSAHFGDEEYCMDLVNYPETVVHKWVHGIIRDELETLLLSNTPLEQQDKELKELKNLIISHINIYDAPLMEYLITGA